MFCCHPVRQFFSAQIFSSDRCHPYRQFPDSPAESCPSSYPADRRLPSPPAHLPQCSKQESSYQHTTKLQTTQPSGSGQIYSYPIASITFTCAARLAGHHPASSEMTITIGSVTKIISHG